MEGRMVEATSFPLYLREGSPVSFAEKAGWAPETVWIIKEARVLDHPARSKSLYRLRCPGLIGFHSFSSSSSSSYSYSSSSFHFAVRRRVPTTIFYTLSYSGPVVSLLVTFFLFYVPILPHIPPILI